MKTCVDCKEEKSIDNFRIRKNVNNTGKEYRNSICNKCLSNRMTEWRKNNPERFREYQNKYHREDYKKNPEKYHKYWEKKYYKDVEKSRLMQRLKSIRLMAAKNNKM